MKTPKILIRIAAILMLVHLLGHTTGFSGWKKATDPAQQEVIKQMTGPRFSFMGAIHSMGDYYDGFGYGCSIGMLLFILVLWFVSGELGASPGLAKKMLLSVAVCLLAWGIDEIICFFPFAACTTLLAFVLTTTAYFLYKPGPAA
jgi:hypothetical protein